VPGRFENARTDTPLLAYHTTSRDDAGQTIEYAVIWSGEDASDPAALMARWGRATDIDWIYRVTVNRHGRRLAETYHAADGTAPPFSGPHERRHPLLRVATAGNDVVPATGTGSRYRFPLDASRSLRAGRAPATLMDANPWTYRVMAAELAREGRLESPASPDTAALSDPRDYLFAGVAATGTGGAGLALAVRLTGDDRWFMSDHDLPAWAIDGASTAVELPPGTPAGDVDAVKAVALPAGTADYRITITALRRGFMLRRGFRPGKSMLDWTGDVTLSPTAPEAVLWRR
jgi:hypothetical protein